MSIYTSQWRQFVNETSYMHILKEQNISNDSFWERYQVYDYMLKYSGYPGEILSRVSSLIPSGSTFLDVGAGTGAFTVPLSRKLKKTIAVDPSEYQLRLLMEKAAKGGIDNIEVISKRWDQVDPDELGHVDFSLASYSFFDEDIEGFLQKMLDVSSKGVFLVFRAGEYDSLSEFAYGRRTSVDFRCLLHILEDLGYEFRTEIFKREYSLPLNLVFRQYSFSKRSPEELAEHLRESGRLRKRYGKCTHAGMQGGIGDICGERDDDGRIDYNDDGDAKGSIGGDSESFAVFSSEDALLYIFASEDA